MFKLILLDFRIILAFRSGSTNLVVSLENYYIPSSNPYLAFGLLIYAGLEGLENGLVPPTVIETNLYADGEKNPSLAKLPSSLKDAAELAQTSEFIKKYVPEEILSSYLKRAEK